MEQEVFLENDFISRNRFDCSWRAMSFPRIVRIVPPPALSCSPDIKSQSWTKFSRFRLGAIPGNDVIFQESPESCHLLFHRVLGPGILSFQ